MAAMLLMATVSCGAQKQVAEQKKGGSPFGDVFEIPCAIYDTDEDFAATGIYRGSMKQKGEVHKFALANAQDIVRMKIKHAYKGMVSNFSSSIGNNNGNDIEAKINMAGDQIIDAVVNNTSENCVKFSAVGDDGHIECYVAIRVSKNYLSEKVSEEVATILSDDEKKKIGFDEFMFRKQMDERFKQYNENK